MGNVVSALLISCTVYAVAFFMSSVLIKRLFLHNLKSVLRIEEAANKKLDLRKRLVTLIDLFEKRCPLKVSLEDPAQVEARLVMAGRPLGLSAGQFVSLKNMCGLVATLVSLASFSLFGLTAAPLVFFAGFFLPELYIRSLISRKRSLVDRELPEAIEIMSIMVTAGLNISQAMRRAGSNLHGPLADELKAVVREVDLGIPRQAALQSFASRMSSDQVRRLVMAIQQAERYGTSLSDTLRVLADESRGQQTRRLKEQAQKIPVKMLFPLVTMVLPAFLILTVGPLMLTMTK